MGVFCPAKLRTFIFFSTTKVSYIKVLVRQKSLPDPLFAIDKVFGIHSRGKVSRVDRSHGAINTQTLPEIHGKAPAAPSPYSPPQTVVNKPITQDKPGSRFPAYLHLHHKSPSRTHLLVEEEPLLYWSRNDVYTWCNTWHLKTGSWHFPLHVVVKEHLGELVKSFHKIKNVLILKKVNWNQLVGYCFRAESSTPLSLQP